MSRPIEELAVIGDTATAAIVTRDGCIPWLCMPRFDSGACFAALVGTDDDGMWSLAPQGDFRVVQHAYSDESLLLETVYETSDGAQVRVVDAMDPAGDTTRLMRLVVGVRGTVRMETRFRIRFDYGRVVPWIHRAPGALVAIAGPDGAALYTNVPLEGHDHEHTATFDVAEGERVGFELVYFPSYERQPGPSDLTRSLRRIDLFWREWARTCSYQGPDRALVMRSLLTLKVLTDAKTGAIAAAPTTSLPEQLGGVRNWDYRYCWLRDATFVLVALLNAGYEAEAFAWRGWLLRAAAGNPEAVQILYGLRGERRLPEFEAAWLAGYAGSRPVRIGNAAAGQFQLDVYGEVVDVMHQAHIGGIPPDLQEWNLTKAVVEAVESKWDQPDRSLWEIRGDPRHFVHSKVLAWVALDRACSAIEHAHYDGPLDRWQKLRDQIHDDVCAKGYDAKRETFTQSYGSRELDAATLLIPLVGFLPPKDHRVKGTVKAIERELLHDGFVQRYSQPSASTDGLPPGEGAFFACGFWLADNYVLQGRERDARRLFDALTSTATPLGLLSEEYDVAAKRLVGNFPQAFSHVGLLNTAYNLEHANKPAHQRRAKRHVEPHAAGHEGKTA